MGLAGGLSTNGGAAGAAGVWLPTDQGMQAWTCDIGASGGAGAIPATAGTIYTMMLKYAGGTVTNVLWEQTAAGSTLTSGQCFVGLYNATTGALVGSSADQSANFALGSGVYTAALVGGPYQLGAGYYRVAFLFNGTTAPTLMRALNGAGLYANQSSGWRGATANTGQTSLPGSLGALASQPVAYWFGLS